MKKDFKSSLFVEDYRPSNIDECILPEHIKKQFKEFIEQGDIPSLMLAGPPGTGKTTLAKALCNEMGCDSLVINCSEDNGIDVLRTKIRDFASTVSLFSDASHKVVIMDESDYLNPTSTMPALRGFIEEFWGNCRFIFTCNYINKIIPPLLSRCSVIEFKFTKEEQLEMMQSFYGRVCKILDENNIKYDGDSLVKFIYHHFPDMRRILNELQRYSMTGEIDVGILTSVDEVAFEKLIDILKRKSFNEMRNWVASNNEDSVSLFNKLYDTCKNYVEDRSIPSLIVILADYSYKAAFVANDSINIVACLTEIMSEVEFK